MITGSRLFSPLSSDFAAGWPRALVSILRDYPAFLATLPARSALTAAYFCLVKSKQNRWLPHTALRFAPGPLAPVSSRGRAAYDLLRQVYDSRSSAYAEGGCAPAPSEHLHSAS